MNKKMKNKKILKILIILVVLLNPISLRICFFAFEKCRKEWLWFRYKEDIYEYVRHDDKHDDYLDEPGYGGVLKAIETYDRRTNDSLKMDSSLVRLLGFRNRKGEILCNYIHLATMKYIIETRRFHLRPYMQALRDSFSSYPKDTSYYTKNSNGVYDTNENIKDAIGLYIDMCTQKMEMNILK